jgi:hypothetical protein
MRFTSDVREFFNLDTLRISTELPKIMFLVAFVYFIYKMAEFTTRNISRLQDPNRLLRKTCTGWSVFSIPYPTPRRPRTGERRSAQILDGH